MKGRKKILLVLWIIVAVIALGVAYFYFTLPHWKGLYIAGSGGFLILNLLIAIFFVNKNFKD
ncbi:MAG: hypothetical protein PHO94_04735 [Petrimonas sp.]|nr:hypothetical protein [Petrimonas sp.]